jgi:hypothetical protein
MARFITVTVQCDWTDCDTTGIEGDDTVLEKTLTIDRGPAKAFLLCEKHLEVLNDVLVPLMQAGIKVEPAAKKQRKSNGAGAADEAAVAGNGHKEETFECRVPDCGRSISKRTGMAQHVTRTHDFESLAAYELQYPAA